MIVRASIYDIFLNGFTNLFSPYRLLIIAEYKVSTDVLYELKLYSTILSFTTLSRFLFA